jgi:hypothetical protein
VESLTGDMAKRASMHCMYSTGFMSLGCAMRPSTRPDGPRREDFAEQVTALH